MAELLPVGSFTGTYELKETVQPPPSKNWFYRFLNVITGGLGSPTVYRYVPNSINPLTYTTSSGLIITPQEFDFDGATTPRFSWAFNGFSPWDWPRAAAIHDWLYQCHHDGCDILGFEESNKLLGECCRTLGVSEWKIPIIVDATNRFGKGLWDAKD